jgi:cytochrome P450
VTETSADVNYDPYDPSIHSDPYLVFQRLREEAPLYYNGDYGFYALSRFDDVQEALLDYDSFSSTRGAILEMIKADIEIPKGLFIFDDPPSHTGYRGVISRVFTPKQMYALEDRVRTLSAKVLDPFVGESSFDFVGDLGAQVPMQVIGMLLGIPERDWATVRDHADAKVQQDPGRPRDFTTSNNFADEFFVEYVDWRVSHPADDLMTELLSAEFQDDSGALRRMTRDEVLIFVNLLATAGNETTNRLIGWSGKVLGDHPDQRRELAADRSLLANTVEELMRYESPAQRICRYVTRDVSYYGRTVPQGSVMMLLNGSANRDRRAFPPDGDQFDIHRRIGHHLAFGYGAHFCLGAALARLEARVVLDEVLNRFPEWSVDSENAKLGSTNVRGWSSLPVFLQ